MLTLTGFNAALAAEIVSFCICIRVAFLDFFSPGTTGFPSAVGWAAGDDEEDDGGFAGSAVIRSMSVVPDES